MRVIIAVDESDCSQAAVQSVADRIWQKGTEFLVLSVVVPDVTEFAAWHATYVPFQGDAQEELLAQAGRLVKERVEYLKQKLPTHRISGKVMEGNIRDAIIKKAEEWKADFIVLGSHGRTGFNRFLLGSVAESVVSRAPCSVEVIRQPVKDHEESTKFADTASRKR